MNQRAPGVTAPLVPNSWWPEAHFSLFCQIHILRPYPPPHPHTFPYLQDFIHIQQYHFWQNYALNRAKEATA